MGKGGLSVSVTDLSQAALEFLEAASRAIVEPDESSRAQIDYADLLKTLNFGRTQFPTSIRLLHLIGIAARDAELVFGESRDFNPEDFFNAAILLDPMDFVAYSELGHINICNDPMRAITYLKTSLAIRASVEAYLSIASAYDELRQYHHAYESLAKARYMIDDLYQQFKDLKEDIESREQEDKIVDNGEP